MLYISIFSAIVAVVAALISYHSLSEQRRITAWTKNFDRLYSSELMMQNYPKLLNLHGINEKLLRKCGAAPEEVVYLLLNFRAGQEWGHLKEKAPLSGYRRQMLENKKVRKIWKNILYKKLIFTGKFAKVVDHYVSLKD